MARVTYTETQADQAQAAEILLPAVVVKDSDDVVIGTVGLSLESVMRRDAKTGESTPTGATRAMAAFTPARQGDRRFSVRESHMRAACEALGQYLGYALVNLTEDGAIVVAPDAVVVSTDDNGDTTHLWEATEA
jgi:hypothetical protein